MNKWVWAEESQRGFRLENKWCHGSEEVCSDWREGALPNTSSSSCWTLRCTSGWEPSRCRDQFMEAAVVSCPCMNKTTEKKLNWHPPFKTALSVNFDMSGLPVGTKILQNYMKFVGVQVNCVKKKCGYLVISSGYTSHYIKKLKLSKVWNIFCLMESWSCYIMKGFSALGSLCFFCSCSVYLVTTMKLFLLLFWGSLKNCSVSLRCHDVLTL